MNVEDRYGRVDRLLHDFAFSAGQAQHAMADVEEILYRDTLEEISPEDPVFVTALPRSGTTILLQLLADSGRFASHTYRDMPFVLCPMLWSRFSSRFAAGEEAMERAHGDGLQVSADSPEAFEEMVWKHFWPDRYRPDRILPWGPETEENAEFDAFLDAHMRKVIALRRDGSEDDRRYVSKNNLNISRLAAPPRPLRRGTALVPFREPVQQAASMLRQHRRFLDIHEDDDFVRRYMEAIGHHEFGRGLRPVDFGGWLDGAGWRGWDAEEPPPAADPEGLEFWVRYWVVAYRHVLEALDGDGGAEVRLVSYARLTGEPEESLGSLAGALDVSAGRLTSMADRLRPPRTHDVDPSGVADGVLDEARGLHGELNAVSAI